jgi:predicted nucleic acid-binding protein
MLSQSEVSRMADEARMTIRLDPATRRKVERIARAESISDSEVRWDLFTELGGASRRALRNAVDDAHLAAVAISRGAALVSCDQDFESFVPHGLRWERLGA